MGKSAYGDWHDICRDSGSAHATIPVCNLFNESPTTGGNGFGGCDLNGINLKHGHVLANIGSIAAAALGILMTLFFLWRTERKRAAVGRREMQLFLIGFIVIMICEIFTVGGFPLNGAVRKVFSAVHIGAVVATSWILLMNAAVGFQILEDGTAMSLGLIVLSAAAMFVGSGYIALDTGFSFTNFWKSTLEAPNKAYALYTVYQLGPAIFLAVYFFLETFLVLRVLGEFRPMIYLAGALILFAIGQIFQYVVSVHLCNATKGKINGGLFETLFTVLSVGMIWVFWSSITEDDWPETAQSYE